MGTSMRVGLFHTTNDSLEKHVRLKTYIDVTDLRHSLVSFEIVKILKKLSYVEKWN